MRDIFLSLLLLFTLLGCQKQPTIEVSPKSIPNWVSNPPSSDEKYIYAVGEGKDKESAQADALSNIASSLSVWVDSQFIIDTKVHEKNGDENYTKESEQKIALHVKQMHIGNFEVVKFEKLRFNSYAMLIRSNKKIVFETLKNESSEALQTLKNDESAMQNTDVLKRLEFYENASKKAEDIVSILSLLKTLQPSFDTALMQEECIHFKESYIALKSKISFEVNADAVSKELVNPMQELISSKGFVLSQKKAQEHLHVKLSSQPLQSTALGFMILRSSIFVEIKDGSNQTIKSKKLDIIGRSAKSFEAAKQNLAIKFREQIGDFL
jgi:hypothetical protein